jgi:anaerobic ribonucleoside-triphosphate reductase activating protein
MSEQLRLHHFLTTSRANGPGTRAVVWLQGCSLHCPGCFNPQTHPFAGGEVVPVAEMFTRLVGLGDAVEGVTLSGGEPLQQLPAVVALLRRLRTETKLSVLVFTGFGWDEVQGFPEAGELLACIDVLIAGRYDEGRRVAHGLLGSSNKTVHFLTPRYTPADLEAVPEAEVILTPEGDILASGIDPVRW